MRKEQAQALSLNDRYLLADLVRREHNRLIKAKLRKDERMSERAMLLAQLKGMYDALSVTPEEAAL